MQRGPRIGGLHVMRWSLVALAACGGAATPPPVAVHAELPPAPVVAAPDPGIVIANGEITCGGTRTELPAALAIVTSSDREVTAASKHGVIRIVHANEPGVANLLQTWADLHVQLEGPLAFGASLDAKLSYRDGTLVIDYAMAHSARLRFAYRRTPLCTFAAIEHAAEPDGAITAIAGDERTSWEPVTDLMKAAGSYECWTHPEHC